MLALTLPGHAGGPPIEGELTDATLPDAVERAMDAAGFETAHLVGNSLGAWIALKLAARGRAETVVAFAPPGGWAPGDPSRMETLRVQAELHEFLKRAAPHAVAALASPEGRRRATRLTTVNYEHIPEELLAHQTLAVASGDAFPAMTEHAASETWALDAERIRCPVRIVWGTEDALLPWPDAAVRYRHGLLPHADWVELEGVGHCPQLDVPVVAAQLILDFTS